MAQNSDDSESHASKVTEGVSNEDLRRELVVFEEGESDEEEGDHQGHGEDVVAHDFV